MPPDSSLDENRELDRHTFGDYPLQRVRLRNSDTGRRERPPLHARDHTSTRLGAEGIPQVRIPAGGP